MAHLADCNYTHVCHICHQPVAVSSLSSANQQRVDMVMDTSTRTQCVCCCQPAGGNMVITAGDCTYYVCTKIEIGDDGNMHFTFNPLTILNLYTTWQQLGPYIELRTKY